MDQRARFVWDFESQLYTMTELCALYGISRKTGYKWLERFVADGVEGLRDRSRAPGRCPHRTPEPVRDALIAFRKKHPRWGPKKLLVKLRRLHPDESWPAVSTAGEILKQAGLVEARNRRRKTPTVGAGPIPVPQAPNELWSADFKGQFRTKDRVYCYPLTIMDRYSRQLLRCQGLRSTESEGAQKQFETVFREYGLPERIVSDNGCPFGSPGLRGLSKLSVWWIRLGIEPLRIQKGCPQENGGHERMHRTLKRYTARPPASHLAAQQERFDAFQKEFNEERPHEALGQTCPSESYRPSPRSFPESLEAMEYPGHFEVRSVRSDGMIKWRGDYLFLTGTLIGERVGLEEVDDGIWALYFGPYELLRYDERTRSFGG